jgi:hypothetical protein
MKTKTYRFTVHINPARDMPGFLDMLRYDGATVADWNGFPIDRFRVVLTGPRCTPDRWESFGLRVRDIEEEIR